MDSNYLGDPSMMGPVLAIFAAFALVFLVLGIIFYIFFTVGLYTLAKNDGDDIPWMAFIPVAQYYTIGKLIRGNFTIFGKRIDKVEMILPIAALVGSIFSAIPVLGMLVAIAMAILFISAMYHLFKKYKGEKATMFTILSVIFAFLYPFFIFGMRNSMPVDLSYGSSGNTGGGFQGNPNGPGGNSNPNTYDTYQNYNNSSFNSYDNSTFGTPADSGTNDAGVSDNSSFDNNDGNNQNS